MKAKNLVILLILAIALIVLAKITSEKKAETIPDVVGKLLIPNLQVNDVAGISVKSAEGTVKIVRSGETWVVPQKYDYPAAFNTIRDNLLLIARLKIGQVVNVDDDQKKEMKLVPPVDGVADSGTLLELFDSADNTLAALVIGETRTRSDQSGSDPYAGFRGYPSGQYVSPDNGQNVYLIKDTLRIPVKATEWLNTELLNVVAADISEIRVTGPERKDVLVTKSPDDSLILAGLADNQEPDDAKLSSLRSAIGYLNFEDIASPSLSDEELGFSDPVVFQAVTDQGAVYRVLLGAAPADNPGRYMRIEASLSEMQDPPPAAGDAEDNEQAAAERQRLLDEHNKLKADIEELNRKVDGYTFIAPSYKAETMLLTRDQLIKDTEEESD